MPTAIKNLLNCWLVVDRFAKLGKTSLESSDPSFYASKCTPNCRIDKIQISGLMLGMLAQAEEENNFPIVPIQCSINLRSLCMSAICLLNWNLSK